MSNFSLVALSALLINLIGHGDDAACILISEYIQSAQTFWHYTARNYFASPDICKYSRTRKSSSDTNNYKLTIQYYYCTCEYIQFSSVSVNFSVFAIILSSFHYITILVR